MAPCPLMNLPLEVTLKILEVMHPGDLLSMTRVDKRLRRTLMHQSSAPIWRNTLSLHEPTLPECPADMSEPRWVNLVFGELCNFCWSTKVDKLDWYLRVRICNICAESCVRTSLYDGFTRLAENMRQLSPSNVAYERLIPARLVYLDKMSFFVFALLRCWTYLITDYEAVKAEYLSIQDDEARIKFCEERAALANANRAHAYRCEIWSQEQKAGKD